MVNNLPGHMKTITVFNRFKHTARQFLIRNAFHTVGNVLSEVCMCTYCYMFHFILHLRIIIVENYGYSKITYTYFTLSKPRVLKFAVHARKTRLCSYIEIYYYVMWFIFLIGSTFHANHTILFSFS